MDLSGILDSYKWLSSFVIRPSLSDVYTLALALNLHARRCELFVPGSLSCGLRLVQDYLGGVHPLFPPIFSSSLYHPLYHPCRIRCGSYIFLAVAFFALCFLHLPSFRGPPPPSHTVLLVFYRSGCFTFLLCDGFCHEPTSYNLIAFPSQHQSHYNSESSFLFPLPPFLPPLAIHKHNRNQQRCDHTLTPCIHPSWPFASYTFVVHPPSFLGSARPRIRCMYFRPCLPDHVSNGPFCSLYFSLQFSHPTPTVVQIYTFETMFSSLSLSLLVSRAVLIALSSSYLTRIAIRIAYTQCRCCMTLNRDSKCVTL